MWYNKIQNLSEKLQFLCAVMIKVCFCRWIHLSHLTSQDETSWGYSNSNDRRRFVRINLKGWVNCLKVKCNYVRNAKLVQKEGQHTLHRLFAQARMRVFNTSGFFWTFALKLKVKVTKTQEFYPKLKIPANIS